MERGRKEGMIRQMRKGRAGVGKTNSQIAPSCSHSAKKHLKCKEGSVEIKTVTGWITEIRQQR